MLDPYDSYLWDTTLGNQPGTPAEREGIPKLLFRLALALGWAKNLQFS